MPLLSLHAVELGFGGEPLLDAVQLTVEADERICLLGPNGTGKSTLLDVLAGRRQPDNGVRKAGAQLRIGVLPQVFDSTAAGTVRKVLSGAFGEELRWIEQAARLSATGDAASAAQADRLLQAIEAAGAWNAQRKIERTLDELAVPADSPFQSLSGGQQRRVLLRRAMLPAPPLLLLDEPTNHLDIEAIEALTRDLLAWRGALLFTTHDRRAIEELATRIIELDRGKLTSWPGDYANYLRRREEREAAEQQASTQQERRLAQEEAWIRQGVKARRTRNQGRVRRLQAMRAALAERRDALGKATFSLSAGQRSGRRISELRGVYFGYGDEPLVCALDLLIERGDRVGIIGPNGAGKTTLVKLVLGHLPPVEGEVRLGTRLEVAYLDQIRQAIPGAATVYGAVADGADHVVVAGERRHVIGYLADFLFPPQRVRNRVSSLSGGEQARLALAKIFAKPSNVLVLDEPTNDLDLATLELLEERLLDYAGTLLVVSHDRAFLDSVVTSTVVFEGNGRIGQYVGGYSDWERHHRRCQWPAPSRLQKTDTAVSEPHKREASPQRPAKLSYKAKRELDALPERIEALEQRAAELRDTLGRSELYRDGGHRVAGVKATLEAVETELEMAFERWSELEARADGSAPA
ncbi:MAG: ATP-binding cassette domain-containing protein [Gammaproteobacteria bacterium]|nr:ATP-binding cassette domain-containing protein [Gammaproteobacteria bacterium]